MTAPQSTKPKMPAWISINAKVKSPMPMPKEKIKAFLSLHNGDYNGDNDNMYQLIDRFRENFDAADGTCNVVFDDHNHNTYSFPIFVGSTEKVFKYRPGPWWKEIEGFVDEYQEMWCSTEDEKYARYIKVKKLKAFE